MIYESKDTYRIRQIEERDVSHLFSWWIDPVLNEFDPRPLPKTPRQLMKECQLFCDMKATQVFNKNPEENIYKYFIIVDLNDIPLGFINMFNFKKEDQSCELGICIGDKSYHRKGIASEAIKFVLDYGFKIMELDRIYIETSEENIPAQELFQKIGMIKCGTYLDEGHRFIVMEKSFEKVV